MDALTNCRHGTLVQLFTQMSGINVINYYQTIMYESLGITGNTVLLVAGIYNCVGPIANLFFIIFILDRVGRRKPLMFGAIAITIALFCEAALNSQNEDGHRRGYSIGGIFFIFCVTVIFSWSFGPCSWYVNRYAYLKLTSQGLHGRGHADADPWSWKRLRRRDWELGCQHALEPSISYRPR